MKNESDRRIHKTKEALHRAIGSLIREQPYDDIVVQEILDRANVGRSTFYMHFRDKDELLASSIHDLLSGVQDAHSPPSANVPERIIRFSLPIFQHVHLHLDPGAANLGPRGRAIIHEHLRRVLAEMIAADMRKALQHRRKEASQIPSELLIHYVASTFILVLNWWAESRKPLPPAEINAVFRAMVLPTVTAALT